MEAFAHVIFLVTMTHIMYNTTRASFLTVNKADVKKKPPVDILKWARRLIEQ